MCSAIYHTPANVTKELTSWIRTFFTDVFGWPQPSCTFPAWVTGYSWRDLSGIRTYSSNTMGSVLTVRHTYSAATPGGKYTASEATSTTREAFRCLSVPDNTPSNSQDAFIALSHSSDDWSVWITFNSFGKGHEFFSVGPLIPLFWISSDIFIVKWTKWLQSIKQSHISFLVQSYVSFSR